MKILKLIDLGASWQDPPVFLVFIGDDRLSESRFQVEKAFCFGTGTVAVGQIKILGFLFIVLQVFKIITRVCGVIMMGAF